jgi:hypothetical protein
MNGRTLPQDGEQPRELRVVFELTKPEHSIVRCTLWTNQGGWELRLFVGQVVVHAKVLSSLDGLDAVVQDWRTGLHETGWR